MVCTHVKTRGWCCMSSSIALDFVFLGKVSYWTLTCQFCSANWPVSQGSACLHTQASTGLQVHLLPWPCVGSGDQLSSSCFTRQALFIFKPLIPYIEYIFAELRIKRSSLIQRRLYMCICTFCVMFYPCWFEEHYYYVPNSHTWLHLLTFSCLFIHKPVWVS